MGKKQFEFIGDNHIASAIEIPMRDDAFTKSDEEKIQTYFTQYFFGTISIPKHVAPCLLNVL
tara:strand:+ start:242 stop:427 length:186 start_codon:yes stop_codon:yes gene_type:complete